MTDLGGAAAMNTDVLVASINLLTSATKERRQPVTDDDIAEVLERAADRIEVYGWWRGETGEAAPIFGEMCPMMAVTYVLRVPAVNVMTALARHLGLPDYTHLPQWNAEQPDAEAVIDAMRRCVAELRESSGIEP